MTIPAAAGIVIILVVLWEAFETVVLPRRVTRRLRITVLFYRATWVPWRSLAGRLARKRRDALLSYYGPLSLLMLFMLWALGLMVGFALLLYGVGESEPVRRSFGDSLYWSGTTIFTLGLGDLTPRNGYERLLLVAESGLGFGFLALVISYLPVIYQAFSRREVNIVLLDARAGSPPTAAELLRRHSDAASREALETLLRDWERWSAEILESHISYPVVSYFRSQHGNESWLAALTAILDACAVLISACEDSCSRQAQLTFAICRHAVVDLAQVFNARPVTTADRLLAPEMDRFRAAIADAGFWLPPSGASAQRFSELRGMYEPYVLALGARLAFEVPPWILGGRGVDNWRTSAWGRIRGFTAAAADPPQDDH